MEFNYKLPHWENAGVEPSPEWRRKGYEAGESPAANTFNWFLYAFTGAVEELQGIVAEQARRYKVFIQADDTESFFLELCSRLNAYMETAETVVLGCTHDGKDYYFGFAYKSGSYIYVAVYGGLQKTGYFATYNASSATVSFRNLPNENFSALNTSNKANLVAAINEVKSTAESRYLYGNLEAESISEYLKQVCVLVCAQDSGTFIYRGAWTGNSYYTGTFYKTSAMAFGTVVDHNGKSYFCTYTSSSDSFSYKVHTTGDLNNLSTTDKSSLVAAINEVLNKKADATTHNIKTYTNLSQLGLSNGATMLQVAKALPGSSSLRIYVLTSENAKLAPTATNGWLEVNRPATNHVEFRYTTTSRMCYYAVVLNVNNSNEQLSEWTQLANTSDLADYLPLSGGTLTGALTVIDNFNVNKTFDDVEYKTYIRPINYSIASNGDYSTALLHCKGAETQAQLMFNKDGVMLRDNVNGKAYKIYGQHNASELRSNSLNRTTAVNAADTNYTTLMARGTSLNSAETNPAVNGAIAWTYQ